MHIDLDASDDAHFHIWYLLNDVLNVMMCDAVHSVGQLGHRLLCLLDLIKVRLKCLSDVDVLVVKRVSPSWNHNSSQFVRLWLPFVSFKPSVCSNSRAACDIMALLALSVKLTEFTIRSDANVRTE